MAQRAVQLGWKPIPGESDLDNLLRGDLIRGMGIVANDPDTVAQARPLAQAQLRDANSVDPGVGQAALFVMAAHGTADDFALVRAAHDTAPTPQLRQRYLQALTAFDSDEFTAQIFDWTFDGSVRGQDSAWVVARMLGNRTSGPGLWKLVRSRWDEVIETYPKVTIRHIFDGLPHLSEPDVARDVTAFFAETEVSSSKTLAQMLEVLEVQVALRKREGNRHGANTSG